MWTLVGFVIFIFIVLIFAAAFLEYLKQQSDLSLYQRLDCLFTPAERSFLGVLDQAVGDSYRIFAKVRLADLFAVRPGLESNKRMQAFSKISSKHIDFVICDPANLQILAAIELDDKSHQQIKRQIRDEFVNRLFEQSGIKLGRVPAQKSYSLTEVVILLRNILEPCMDEEPVDVDDFSLGDEIASQAEKKGFKFNYIPKSKPLCPACNNAMNKCENDSGEEMLWRCSMYPKCNETMPPKLSKNSFPRVK